VADHMSPVGMDRSGCRFAFEVGEEEHVREG
jgi:hypothetical protein